MKIVYFLIIITLLVIIFIPTFAQERSDTSKVLISFNEPMSHEGIFNVDNYHIYNEDSNPVKIYKIGIAPGDSTVVLFTEKQNPKYSYTIVIDNLKDKSGNSISESHKTAAY